MQYNTSVNVHLGPETEADRRRLAYQQGDLARDEGRITDAAHTLYERLIVYCGTKTYCWPALETVAGELRVSVRTLKRRLSELVDIGLVRRVRRWATSWLTYVCAYDEAAEQLSLLDHGPSQGPNVAPDPIKDRQENPEGGGKKRQPATDDQPLPSTSAHAAPTQPAQPQPPVVLAPDTEQTRRLLAERVTETLPEFAGAAMSLIERAITRASAVRDKDDPRRAGLIVYFLRRLLAGSWIEAPAGAGCQSALSGGHEPASSTDFCRCGVYVYALHTRQQCPHCGRSPHPEESPPATEPAPDPPAGDAEPAPDPHASDAERYGRTGQLPSPSRAPLPVPDIDAKYAQHATIPTWLLADEGGAR